MGLVFALGAMLWGVGMLVGAGRRLRFGMLAVLFGGVVLMQLVLPDGHGARVATGGSAGPWLLLWGLIGIGLVYAGGVRALKRRARVAGADTGARPGVFSERELDRYARHIVLREIGGPGQKRLKQARVLVVGAGGLGAPALLYLAAAGVGTIGVIDDDEVENSNLQRQVIHRVDTIGMPKVFSAKRAMKAQNPDIEVRAYHRRLDEGNATELFGDYDVILDGTDNFATRYLVNRFAVETGKPLISGALSQWEGQLSVFDPAKGGPCYQCIFPEAPADGLGPSCAEAGVIGPLPGVVGAMMALEAIKLITGAGAGLRGEMLIYDGLFGESRKLTLKQRENCPVCGVKQEVT
ncbi:MAG: HesA/MoeB/ThiF family protein [Rhodobacteraceae bacterium]|nr:HesA/MoeB/ThiF family protein [Paracoccaceae bacterium]